MSYSATMQQHKKKPLVLIVAATRSMGIGRAGTLPWPQLRQEMAYFARVTKASRGVSDGKNTEDSHKSAGRSRNAVIMGRRTWDSIPARFRPLAGRTNVVLTRNGHLDGQEQEQEQEQQRQAAKSVASSDNPLVVASLQDALARLDAVDAGIERLFVIGGESIYREALTRFPQRATAILMTRVRNDFECDTFFPLDLDGADARSQGWRRRSHAELEAFARGDESGSGSVAEGVQHEAGVEYEFTLYERTDE